jgi:hypothetical protein
MTLAVVFLHRNRTYAKSIGRRLTESSSNELVIQQAESLARAEVLLPRADRLLFDADDDFMDVLAHTGVPSYALTTKLDAALSAALFKRGAIAVGACTSDEDVMALAETLVAGVAASPHLSLVLDHLAVPTQSARVRSHEQAAILKMALHYTRHNVTKAAKLLGLPRSTVQSQMAKFGLLRRL